MRKIVKKLYQGTVDVRSHEAELCIKENEHLIIIYNSSTMTLTAEELVSKRLSISALFKNKTKNGRDYYLYSYRWCPDN